MSQWAAGIFERQFGIQADRTIRLIHSLGGIGAALFFTAATTLIMAFNTVFLDQSLANLEVGSVVPRDIIAPETVTWISEVQTQQGRDQAYNNVEDVYDLPDANVARQQTQLAARILEYIGNVRRDPYASVEQKIGDLSQITALDLNEGVMRNILELEDDTWRSVDEQIRAVLERVMQQPIRENDVWSVVSRLPNQVSVRFSQQETAVITAIIGDLVRPNSFVNEEETERARQRAADEFEPVRRTFVAGQRVVEARERLTVADVEALQQLGLLEISPDERFTRQVIGLAQAFMVSILVIIMTGLFTVRFVPSLLEQPRLMLLGSGIFLLFLIGVRIWGGEGETIYLVPTAGMALLLVAIIGPEVAIAASLGMAFMVGFMIDLRLELAVLVAVGGLIGTLTLRRAERLNSYFFAGLVIALANTIVIAVFNVNRSELLANSEQLPELIALGALNGLLSAAAAISLMYLVTLLFNLPTGLRLVELSQPNHPMLQRLLREAPGTYQHSLQVANLAEQATSAIGGSAELVRVAALYHDIGKALNAPFFVENQADHVNPHDALNDPYRSADIIISHVVEGDKLARQHRLPGRVRDFIREHHGTTRVEYFYRQAIAKADSQDDVDPTDFTYPGPIPQSRETAIMMLADSCESTVRARRPSSRQEIQEIVQSIIDARNKSGQLDESGLTANDIKTIRGVFVDMLQAVFHPRINYPSGLVREPKAASASPERPAETSERPAAPEARINAIPTERQATPKPKDSPESTVTVDADSDEDVSPLPDVPPLPRRSGDNKTHTDESDTP